jgi:hypothetical protein
VAAWSKAWVCSCLLAGIAGLNPAGGMDVFLLSVVYCQVEVSVMGQSLIHRSLTESQCDLETSPMRKPRPTRAVEP